MRLFQLGTFNSPIYSYKETYGTQKRPEKEQTTSTKVILENVLEPHITDVLRDVLRERCPPWRSLSLQPGPIRPNGMQCPHNNKSLKAIVGSRPCASSCLVYLRPFYAPITWHHKPLCPTGIANRHRKSPLSRGITTNITNSWQFDVGSGNSALDYDKRLPAFGCLYSTSSVTKLRPVL